MKIDNYRKAIAYKFYFPIIGVGALSIFIYSLIEQGNLNLIYYAISLLLVVLYVFLAIRKPNYFYFEPRHSTIIIRYYSPQPFFFFFKAFEIPINYFSSYEIKQKFSGYKKSIIFKIKKGKSTGQYPSVSISLLSQNEIDQLKKELDTILKIKRLK